MTPPHASMISIVISNDDRLGELIQTILLQMGIDCNPEFLSIETFQNAPVNHEPRSKLYFIDIRDRIEQAVALFRRLKHQSNANYIAIGDSTNPYEVIEILKEGADDFLDISENLHFQTVNAIKRFQSKSSETESSRGTTTIVTGASGGSGASILAQNLAVAAVRTSQTCGLLDYDLRKGDQASLLNLRPIHTLVDLCESFDVVDKKMVEQSFTAHESGVRLLAAPEPMTDPADISAAMLCRLTDFARDLFDQIVIDLPAFYLNQFSDLLDRCDRLMIVFRTDFSSIKNTIRQLETLQGLGFDTDRLDLVANKWGAATNIETEEIQKAIGHQIPYSICDDPKIFHCVNCGKPILTEWPKSDVSQAIMHMFTKNQTSGIQDLSNRKQSWFSSIFSSRRPRATVPQLLESHLSAQPN